MARQKVLITGCAGYIGSQLTERLLYCGYNVVGVDNLFYGNATALSSLIGKPRFTFLKADVRDFTKVWKTEGWNSDIIIPLAALVGAPICEQYPIEAEAINYLSVKSFVDAASPRQLILYPQTNSGYGATDGNRPVSEEDPLHPISVYGRTKCEAEKVVLDHPYRAVFRLATVFGVSPRMRFDLMVNDFTAKLCHRKTMGMYQPHFKRNFVHVLDVCEAFNWVLMSPHTRANLYNLGHPDANMTKAELANTICKVIGIPETGVYEEAGEDPDKRNYIVSSEKIQKDGFLFTKTLQEGIAEVATFWKALEDKDVVKDMGNYI